MIASQQAMLHAKESPVIPASAESLPKNNEFGKFPNGRLARPPQSIFEGAKFGKLTVIGDPDFLSFPSKDRPNGKWRWVVMVQCECGTVQQTLCQNLLRAFSCGCTMTETQISAITKHGGSRSRLYGVWKGMLSRCICAKHKNFRHYGGRGIIVAAEWWSFAAFRDWAIQHGWKPELEIDRKDNDGPYAPWNCQITTHRANNRNKRDNRILTAFGESKCAVEWAEDPRCRVCIGTLMARLRYGWPHHRAIITPPLIVRQRRSTVA